MKEIRIEAIAGLMVFALGVGLLCLTFYLAFSSYLEPEKLFPFSELIPSLRIEGPEGLEKALIEAIGNLTKLSGYIIAALLLWIMGSIGGRIAKIGIEIYRSKEKKET